MPSAAQLNNDDRLIALFVGESGAGKTPASCSWFHEGKVLVLDFDFKISTLRSCKWLDLDKIDYQQFPVVSEVVKYTVFDRLNKQFEQWQIMVQNRQPLPFKTLVLSSLHSFQYALLKDAISFTHQNGRGRSIGPLKMSDPSDYNFASNAINDTLTFLKTLPINLVVECQVIDKYEKKNPDDPYSQSAVVGSKLAITDKLAATVPGGFSNIIEFEKYMAGDKPQFRARFYGDLARTTYAGLPYGWRNITDKDFYLLFKELREASQKSSSNDSEDQEAAPKPPEVTNLLKF